MTHVTDAHAALVTARNRLGEAFCAEFDEGVQAKIAAAFNGIVKAIAALEQISQPGTSPQQTGDGANLSPAGDQE